MAHALVAQLVARETFVVAAENSLGPTTNEKDRHHLQERKSR